LKLAEKAKSELKACEAEKKQLKLQVEHCAEDKTKLTGQDT